MSNDINVEVLVKRFFQEHYFLKKFANKYELVLQCSKEVECLLKQSES